MTLIKEGRHTSCATPEPLRGVVCFDSSLLVSRLVKLSTLRVIAGTQLASCARSPSFAGLSAVKVTEGDMLDAFSSFAAFGESPAELWGSIGSWEIDP